MPNPPVPAPEKGKFYFKLELSRSSGTGEQVTVMILPDTSPLALIAWIQTQREADQLIWFTHTDGRTLAYPARVFTQVSVSNPSPADLRHHNVTGMENAS